ncbi:enoyl-CoA hydratase [Mycobacterium colombiense]|uniref:enoyl-CoA hydratase/isomerase family protein n=1 Tax=Mycobacterium colombiense TaxID=339268 RepID=UPI0007EFB0E2|nr:enoyl-CoA hydratase/isomerase family protein [Mycobacterium colombiense]OBK68566.1 enoyl-CoA hydratase [Mycobacterium colombiense]
MTSTSSDLLRYEEEGPIRILTLNDPDRRNPMTDELHEAFVDVWVRIMRDREVRAVVLTGAGKAFSAGGDVPGFVRSVEDVEYRRWSMRNARLLVDHILGCHVPVIAAVNGPAVGLGCSVAVSCDIVLMADTAYMADTHVNVGLVAGDGGVVTWPFMMSMLKAKEYLFTGERISAQLAVELGLANRVVPHEDLMADALALAAQLAQQPPQALQETKRSLNLHLQHAALQVLPFALSAETESFSSPEVAATSRAFAARSGA